MNLNRIIQKPQSGEFPSYASMYIDLIPSDGLLLTHLRNNLEEAKKLTNRCRMTSTFTGMPRENGRSKKFWYTSLTTSASMIIGPCVLPAMTKQNYPGLIRINLRFIQKQMRGPLKVFWRSTKPYECQRSLGSTAFRRMLYIEEELPTKLK